VGQLLLLFVVTPAIELALLIEIGSRFGTLHTLALIAITGVVGATLARHQGLRVLREVQAEIAAGRIPAGSLVDGAIILFAGALLMTPGVLTDAFGFACLIPAFRGVLKRLLQRRFDRAVAEGRVHVVGSPPHGPPDFGPGGRGQPIPPFQPPAGRGPVYDLDNEED